MAGGYEICGVACFVRPEVLVHRQVSRAARTGRLVRLNKACSSDDLLRNAALEQADIVTALPYLAELVARHGGKLLIFDNTADFGPGPAAVRAPPLCVQHPGGVGHVAMMANVLRICTV